VRLAAERSAEQPPPEAPGALSKGRDDQGRRDDHELEVEPVKHVKSTDRQPAPVNVEGAVDVKKAGLITEADRSPTAAMRLFEVAPGGSTPFHEHDWEHVVYVLEGEGTLKTENGDAEFRAGDALLAEPGEEHNFVNTGGSTLKFLCVVPLKGDA
jgi:quercetin dioxygenase-like cupin family protein